MFLNKNSKDILKNDLDHQKLILNFIAKCKWKCLHPKHQKLNKASISPKPPLHGIQPKERETTVY